MALEELKVDFDMNMTESNTSDVSCVMVRDTPKDRMFFIACYLGVLSAICVIGLLGNTLAFIVMRSERLTRGATFLLQVLAVVDNFHLVTCWLWFAFLTMYFFIPLTEPLLPWYPLILPYLLVLDLAAHATSVWILVLAIIERHSAVCHPSYISSVTKHTRRCAIAVPFLAVILHIPRIFEYKLKPICHSSYQDIAHSTFRDDLSYNIYKNAFYFLFILLLPTLIFTICNIRMIRAVRKSQFTIDASHRVVSDIRLTQMLITVVAVFLLCHIPDYVIRTHYIIVFFLSVTNADPDAKLVALSNLLLPVNSAVNCFIYCYIGSSFRKTLCSLFKCKKTSYDIVSS